MDELNTIKKMIQGLSNQRAEAHGNKALQEAYNIMLTALYNKKYELLKEVTEND